MGTSERTGRGAGWVVSSLLLAVAAVHLYLYFADGYRFVPTIGWLFVLTSVVAVGLALAMTVRPHRVLAAAAGLFCSGVLGGYVLSLVLPDGIFGFRETGVSIPGYVAIVGEAGVAVVAAAWVLTSWRPDRP